MNKSMRGFTLIELMIVVVIIAILASIAYPSYSRYVIKARRTSGAACMMEVAQFAERYYTTHMSYNGVALPNTACMQDTSPHYVYAIGAGDDADTTYLISANGIDIMRTGVLHTSGIG